MKKLSQVRRWTGVLEIMNQKKIVPVCLAGALLFGGFSLNANAFSVWAVHDGALSSSNTAGTALRVSPGINTIDLYFNTEGDISWGWDILLDVTGTGTVSGVSGGDINGGLGTSQPDGGWKQLGGNPAVDLNNPAVLMFTFIFDADPDALLSIGSGSSYTSGTSFQSEPITAGVLVQAVPLPAAAWLFFSGLGALGVARRRTNPAT